MTLAEPYIRGAGPRPVSGRRLVAVLCAVALVAVAIVGGLLAASTAGEAAQGRLLRTHGVDVDAVVTGCVGLASGTGITASAFRCRATFRLGARHYTALLRGSATLRPTGQLVRCRVLVGNPASLTLAAAIRGTAAG